MRGKRIPIAIITVSLFIGVFFQAQINVWAKSRYDDLQLFAKVLNLVQEYYVEPVDMKKLIYGGIKGMLNELDPHTNFMPPDIYEEFENETSGEFGGLGIEITVKDNLLTIISPIEDTPADKAGIEPGDKILKINGKSTKGMSLVEAAKNLKGKRGQVVVLEIFRDGFDKGKDFEIKRGTVKIKSVKLTDLGDGYVYVKVTSFIEKTAKDFKRQLDGYIKKHKNINGLVIDLRRNPGGLLGSAVKIADYFLEKGIIVSTIGRNKKEKEVLRASRVGGDYNFPVVVLINEYSASASEIVAGALQDNNRALIMGQRSFGKGSVQSVVKLGDGSGLKLTVARYYTPKGVSIQAYGITPDVYIDNLDTKVIEKARIDTLVRREKDIEGHLRGDLEVDAKEPGNEPFLHYIFGEKKSDKKLSSSLINEDFYVLQGYNYLRAWSRMKAFGTVPEDLKKKKQ